MEQDGVAPIAGDDPQQLKFLPAAQGAQSGTRPHGWQRVLHEAAAATGSGAWHCCCYVLVNPLITRQVGIGEDG